MASFKTAAALREYCASHGIPIALDDALDPPGSSPLAQRLATPDFRIGNRFCILPMEGWDGTLDGQPTDLTRRRWLHSGA